MSTGKVALLLLLIAFAASHLQAQTAAEAAAMTSNSGIAAQTGSNFSTSDFSPSHRSAADSIFAPVAREKTPASPKPATGGAGSSLIAPSGPPPDETNRKYFEINAGRDAGKVLFRSDPSDAQVFVNHLLVGHTPLLMFLAPGEYGLDMQGPRQETGHRMVGVMPKETQTVLIDLNQRYPATVSIHW
jgi:PEGA domain